jgi:uncharacterized membrane protein
MPVRRPRKEEKPYQAVKMSRLEALGDAVFAFALTLLALDLRLPEIAANQLAQGIWAIMPKLLIFVFAFLVIAQQWDVHQRTMMHIANADGVFIWLYILSLMFVVLMPASADILGRFPLQPLALLFFGVNTALLCLASLSMWLYASRRNKLLDSDMKPYIIRLITRLWMYPPIIIALTLPLVYLNVYIVYIIWVLMPVISYSYSTWMHRRFQKEAK